MNAKLIKLALDQLATPEKFVDDADDAKGLEAIIAIIKSTLALALDSQRG